MILYVYPSDVAFLWPQLEPLVIRALRGTPTHDADDVRTALIDGAAHLIIQWQDRVEAMAVTQEFTYPKGKWLNIWLLAARPDVRLDNAAFYAFADAFRKQQGCRGMQAVSARLGWLKRHTGWQLEGSSLRWTESE